MTGIEAEKILKEHGGTCHLTRYSESNKKYMLSVIQRLVDHDQDDFTLQHYELNIRKSVKNGRKIKIEIEECDEQFDSLSALLSYYKKNAVDHDISSIGVMVKAKKHLVSVTVCVLIA